VPGFGHRLYPGGDPRGAELLACLRPTPGLQRLIAAAEKATGTFPNIDFALGILEKQLRLPRGAAFGIFATGRVVGWIAHALEQWRDGQLIRPRATYVGR
jgi:citrate synthase